MIKTYSAFTYGHTITDDNSAIIFNEGAGELIAYIEIGSYTLQAFVNAVAIALNDTGNLEYTVSLDRSTRKITISSTGAFDLLITSGSLVETSVFSLMGFDGADLTGLTSYEGDSASGSYFEPQFLLQSYVDFDDNVKTENASVNKTPNGDVEVVSYGKFKFMECNITLQTNIKQGEGSCLKNDPTGYDNLRAFLEYATNKAPMEFIKDISQPSIYIDCLLESTRESSDGVNYKVKELYSKGFAEYYESGLIVFRKLI